MGLAAELGVPLESVDLNAAEKAIESGGLCPEGVHHAVLETAGEKTLDNGSKKRVLTFKVLAGPGKDAEVEDDVWLPSEGQDAGKKKKTQNRLTIFMHRLGLLKTKIGGDGKEHLAEVEGKHDFVDCIGTTVFIEVKHEEEAWKDKKTGTDRKAMKAKLTFEGVLKPDDKKCQGVPTGKAPPPGTGPAAIGGGAKKPDNFDDL